MEIENVTVKIIDMKIRLHGFTNCHLCWRNLDSIGKKTRWMVDVLNMKRLRSIL